MAEKRPRSMSASASRQQPIRAGLPVQEEELLNEKNDSYSGDVATLRIASNKWLKEVLSTTEQCLITRIRPHKSQVVTLVPTYHGNLIPRDDCEIGRDRSFVRSAIHRRRSGKKPRRNAMALAVVGESNTFCRRKTQLATHDCHDIARDFRLLQIRVS